MTTTQHDQRDTADNEILIAVMGGTGSGKSLFINRACDSEALKVGHDVQSCTETVDEAPPFELDGRTVRLFDTPGFDDSNKSESEILRIIAFELENQFRQGVHLHGIIYVHRISDVRVGGLAKANFGIFRKLCGEKSLRNVIIVTNMWTKVTKEEGERRVEQLASMEDFFKDALDKGSVMMHQKRDTVESVREIVKAIMKNHPSPLAIQEELVTESKDINQTSAGQEVDKRVAAVMEEYERKMKEQLEAAEEARRMADEETRKELQEEREKNERKLEKLREETSTHAEQYRMLQAQLKAIEEEQRKSMAEAAAERSRMEARLASASQSQSEQVRSRFPRRGPPPQLSYPRPPRALVNRNRFPPGHPMSAENRGSWMPIPGRPGQYVRRYY